LDKKINYDSILRLLTLRYDPMKKPGRLPLKTMDFIPEHNVGDIELRLISIIRDHLLHKQKELRFKQVSLSLGSGIDSGFTLAMIRSVLPGVDIECISIGFGDVDDEVSNAEEIALLYDCHFRSIIIKDVFLSNLPKLIEIVKEPRWNLYPYYMFEYGKRKSNTFYTGDGGDELFAGYVFRYQKFLSILSPKAGWKEKVKLYLSCHERDWVPDQPEIFGSKVHFSWEKIYKLFEPYFNNNDLHPLNQVFLADFNGKLLYDYLLQNKAFGKFLDLNIQSIFLIDDMIKFATRIPWYMKYDPNTTLGKIPLRSILAKHKGLEKITAKPIKKGFSVNLDSLWKKRDTQEIISSYVNSDSEIVKDKLISKRWLISVQSKMQENNYELYTRYISKTLSLLALEVWYKLFVSKTMKKTQKL
jgi:asparagine synthase (glutamine-hydrolysing)